MSKSKKEKAVQDKQVTSSSGAASGRDLKIAGDVITIRDVRDGAAVAAGRGASAKVQHGEGSGKEIHSWLAQMETAIETQPKISPQDKEDLKEQASKIAVEMEKGEKANKDRLERLVNVLSVMAPDIFEVAIATLGNPLAGIGLVIKKVGEKAKLTPQSAA